MIKGKNLESFRHTMGKEMMKKLADIVSNVCDNNDTSPELILKQGDHVRDVLNACVDEGMGLFEIGLAVNYTLDLMEEGGILPDAKVPSTPTIH